MTIDTAPSTTILDAPPHSPDIQWGRWSPLILQLEELGGHKTLRLVPMLTAAEEWAIRSAAGRRGWGLHLRRGRGETYVWLGKRRHRGGGAK